MKNIKLRNIAEVQSKMFNVYSKVLLAWGRYVRVQLSFAKVSGNNKKLRHYQQTTS